MKSCCLRWVPQARLLEEICLDSADADSCKTLPHRLVQVTALAVQARYKEQVGTMASKNALEAKGELLKDKWVLITGASKGIGEAVAVKFAQQGAKIALVARSQDKLEDVSVNCICNNAHNFYRSRTLYARITVSGLL